MIQRIKLTPLKNKIEYTLSKIYLVILSVFDAKLEYDKAFN